MSEDDWEPDLESEEEPPSDDESRGQSDGAGSSMGSDGSENEEDWQAGSEPHRHAGTHNLWLVEDHTTGDKVRQARLKPVHRIRTPAGRTRIANGMPTKS